MPKKKSNKKSKSYSQSWLIKLSIFIILLIILKITVGYIATIRDKANFKKIEKDVLTVQSELQKKNPQINTVVNRYCEERKFKFDSPEKFCTVKIKSERSYSEEELLKNTQLNNDAVINSGFVQTRQPDYKNIFYTGSVEKKSNGASCRLDYDSDLSSLKEKVDKYYFSFSCTRKVHKFIY
ncbi:hypothetical protein A3F37_00705 [Candidatus Saccharibacteria bacterium RIFCSPHIGHO2_12_FULL_41_12]|nr:MAG: hypothetical protein A3F37_00705 [Candidatus Saccharibacteria bacterium RIFCSPHIGHO2_12_FULL_41_12]